MSGTPQGLIQNIKLLFPTDKGCQDVCYSLMLIHTISAVWLPLATGQTVALILT